MNKSFIIIAHPFFQNPVQSKEAYVVGIVPKEIFEDPTKYNASDYWELTEQVSHVENIELFNGTVTKFNIKKGDTVSSVQTAISWERDNPQEVSETTVAIMP